ncbi:hypothetical protein K2X33_10360 [bacterium]|nr:hypothetical protein [bacterium]
MKKILWVLLLLISCTKKPAVVVPAAAPDEVVRQFIQLSAAVKAVEDRQKLAALCQGRMRKAFDAVSDDAFLISYVNQPLKIKSLTVMDVKSDGNLGRVHYKVEVENPQGQDITQEISEREVEMLRVDGQWYLEAIRPKGSDQVAFTRGMLF